MKQILSILGVTLLFAPFNSQAMDPTQEDQKPSRPSRLSGPAPTSLQEEGSPSKAERLKALQRCKGLFEEDIKKSNALMNTLMQYMSSKSSSTSQDQQNKALGKLEGTLIAFFDETNDEEIKRKLAFAAEKSLSSSQSNAGSKVKMKKVSDSQGGSKFPSLDDEKGLVTFFKKVSQPLSSSEAYLKLISKETFQSNLEEIFLKDQIKNLMESLD